MPVREQKYHCLPSREAIDAETILIKLSRSNSRNRLRVYRSNNIIPCFYSSGGEISVFELYQSRRELARREFARDERRYRIPPRLTIENGNPFGGRFGKCTENLINSFHVLSLCLCNEILGNGDFIERKITRQMTYYYRYSSLIEYYRVILKVRFEKGVISI